MIDPEASKIALTANFPNITIAGNVANQVFPTKEFMEEVHSVPNPYSELFYKYYDLSFPFWDETAAALMVDPSLSVNQTSGKPTWNAHSNCVGMVLTISSISGRGHVIWQPQLWKHPCVPEGACAPGYPGGELCVRGGC